MKDLMRNYRKIIHRVSDSESDTESQPLMSSFSSRSSFGAIGEPSVFKHEFDLTESENLEHWNNRSIQNASPTGIHKHLKRHLFAEDSWEVPEPLIYSNTESCYIYESYPTFEKLNDIIAHEGRTSQKDHYRDYNDAEVPSTNSSLVTIFAIWNTTMGSSLLAMSWGLEKTGLFPGIAINILLAGICLYTCYLLLNVNDKHGMIGQNYEVCDLCKMLIGRWAEIISKIFSLIVLIGANIVYWILMSNFFYNSVLFIYDVIFTSDNVPQLNMPVICPKESIQYGAVNITGIVQDVAKRETVFESVWDLFRTVPLFLAVIMFPMLNFKSATFFTKFNSLGTLSVMYVLIFVSIKSYYFGVNIPNWSAELYIKPTFCALSGMLSLSYFIHNIIISVMRNNRRQDKNARDLSIAFGLVTFTYLFVGVLFYICFPLAKSCIEDNILNNFPKNDALTIVARILLLFQLFTVFPLISYMLRNDIMANINMLFKNYRFGDFTYGRVVLLNTVVVVICILFACFLPRIGTLIRYTGALSGLVYIFMLPSLLKIASLKKEGNLTTFKLVLYITIILIGILNLISQFFISDK